MRLSEVGSLGCYIGRQITALVEQGTADSAPNQYRIDRQPGLRLYSDPVVPMKENYQIHGRICSRFIAFSAIGFQLDKSGHDALSLSRT